MTSLFNFLLQFFNKIFSFKVNELGFKSSLEIAKFAAYKTLIYTVLFSASIVVVSFILDFVFSNVCTYLESVISSTINLDSNVNLVLNSTQFFAYLVNVLRIQDCLQIIFSALLTKFTLKFIPFIRF